MYAVCVCTAVLTVHLAMSAAKTKHSIRYSSLHSCLSSTATTPYVFVVNQTERFSDGAACGFTVDLKSKNIVQHWTPEVCKGGSK